MCASYNASEGINSIEFQITMFHVIFLSASQANLHQLKRLRKSHFYFQNIHYPYFLLGILSVGLIKYANSLKAFMKFLPLSASFHNLDAQKTICPLNLFNLIGARKISVCVFESLTIDCRWPSVSCFYYDFIMICAPYICLSHTRSDTTSFFFTSLIFPWVSVLRRSLLFA